MAQQLFEVCDNENAAIAAVHGNMCAIVPLTDAERQGCLDGWRLDASTELFATVNALRHPGLGEPKAVGGGVSRATYRGDIIGLQKIFS